MQSLCARVLRSAHAAALALPVVGAVGCDASHAEGVAMADAGAPDAATRRVPCQRPYELDTSFPPRALPDALALTPLDDALLVMTEDAFRVLSPDGRDTERARIARTDTATPRAEAWPVAFAGERAYTVVARGTALRVLEVDLTAGTSRELATLAALPPALVWSGERLVWAELDDAASQHGQRIVAFDPHTGELSEIPVDVGPFAVELAVLAADRDTLIVDVSLPVGVSQPDPAVLAVPGIYRVAQADGQSDKLVEGGGVALDLFGLFGAGPRSEAQYASDAVYLRAGSVDYARFYRASGADAAQTIACLELDERWVQAFAVQNGRLAIALSDGSTVAVVQYAP